MSSRAPASSSTIRITTSRTRTRPAAPSNCKFFGIASLANMAEKDSIAGALVALNVQERPYNSKGMKRKGQLYQRICSLENLFLADQKARKGKGGQFGIRAHMANWEAGLYSLHYLLLTGQFKTSPYTTFTIFEPKERQIFRLPYYPDRIVHHAVMNILEPIFSANFTADTYSCIKGRGIHGASKALKRALRDQEGTCYCLKLDIRKFYPSIDHSILKRLLQRKFKDAQLLDLLFGIIDSAPGLPIGNYLSQYFANFYLSGFDHWLKEKYGVRYYFRYADDLVILAATKAELHALCANIREYLQQHLRLQLKGNYQVFPVASRGIDFVGYRFFHTHTLLRKSIKKNFVRKMISPGKVSSVASYYGWIVHCNGGHLFKKLINEKIRRHGDKGIPEKFLRRQDQDRPAHQQTNNGL